MSVDNTANKAETAVAYAALVLADEGIEITPDKLQALLKAANIEDVEPIWTTLFAKALQGKDIKDILTTISTSAPEVAHPVVANEEDNDGTPIGDQIKADEGGSDESDMEGGIFGLFD